MKMANVVSVRDVAPAAPVEHPELNHAGKRKHIEDLLRRYPDIRETETQEVVRFLATGPFHDRGMVEGNDAFKEKIAAIRKANSPQLRVKLHELLLFVCGVGGPAAFLLAKYLLV